MIAYVFQKYPENFTFQLFMCTVAIQHVRNQLQKKYNDVIIFGAFINNQNSHFLLPRTNGDTWLIFLYSYI